MAFVTFETRQSEIVFQRAIVGLVSVTEREGDQIVFVTATETKNDVTIHWPVDTGFSRGSITEPSRIGPLAYQFIISAPYASVIEYGSYPGVGPKTAQFGGETLQEGITINPGIYPTQVPQAPVRRALARRVGDIPTRLGQAQQRAWGR